MPKKVNPAFKGGAQSVGDLLPGDHEQNTPSPLTLQISRLASRFGLPIATATVFAEIIFRTESRG
jgi:hypothetical protein